MKRYKLIIIGLLSIIVVFLVPFGIHIDLGPGPNSIVSMVWEAPLRSAWYSIRFFSAFQYYFQFCFFRLIFMICILLLIVGKYNKKWFILSGVISELIPLALSIPALFIRNSQGENLLAIIFPLPFLLSFDLILIVLIDLSNSKNVDKN